MAEGRFGIFKVLATCTHCGNPVVVNGPLTEPACPSCSRSITLSPDVWGDIIGEYLEDYAGLEPGDGKNCTLMTGEVTVKYDYVRLPPPTPPVLPARRTGTSILLGTVRTGCLSA